MTPDETTEAAVAEKPKYDFHRMCFLPARDARLLGTILAGERSPIALGVAFTWTTTPQGHDFWNDEAARDELSPEGRTAIEEILAQADAIGGAK